MGIVMCYNNTKVFLSIFLNYLSEVKKIVKNNLKLVKLFLFCLICTLGMTIFINKSAVYADEGNLVVISSDKQQLKKGDILTYSLDMQTNEDVMAAMLTIKYDDEKLEPLYAQSDIEKSIQPGSVLNSSTSDYNIDSDGNIKIVMVSNSDKIATGNIDINVEKCETCNNEILSNSTIVLNKASVLIRTEKTETSEDKISLAERMKINKEIKTEVQALDNEELWEVYFWKIVLSQ